MMFVLGLVSAGLLIYSIYRLCIFDMTEDLPSDDESETSDEPIHESEEEPKEPKLPEPEQPPESESAEGAEVEPEVEEDTIWDEYDLESKYTEIQKVIPLLDQPKWKNRVVNRFNEVLEDEDYQADYKKFIADNRAQREKNYYAVVEDTVLNLLEHYEKTKTWRQSILGRIWG